MPPYLCEKLAYERYRGCVVLGLQVQRRQSNLYALSQKSALLCLSPLYLLLADFQLEGNGIKSDQHILANRLASQSKHELPLTWTAVELGTLAMVSTTVLTILAVLALGMRANRDLSSVSRVRKASASPNHFAVAIP